MFIVEGTAVYLSGYLIGHVELSIVTCWVKFAQLSSQVTGSLVQEVGGKFPILRQQKYQIYSLVGVWGCAIATVIDFWRGRHHSLLEERAQLPTTARYYRALAHEALMRCIRDESNYECL